MFQFRDLSFVGLLEFVFLTSDTDQFLCDFLASTFGQTQTFGPKFFIQKPQPFCMIGSVTFALLTQSFPFRFDNGSFLPNLQSLFVEF